LRLQYRSLCSSWNISLQYVPYQWNHLNWTTSDATYSITHCLKYGMVTESLIDQ